MEERIPRIFPSTCLLLSKNVIPSPYESTFYHKMLLSVKQSHDGVHNKDDECGNCFILVLIRFLLVTLLPCEP